MTIEEAKKMDLGAILDFCNEWNDIHGIKEEAGKKQKIRNATQEDIDNFLGQRRENNAGTDQRHNDRVRRQHDEADGSAK